MIVEAQSLVDSTGYRLASQSVIVGVSFLLLMVSGRVSHRTGNQSLTYIARSFLVLFCQATFMLSAFTWSAATASGLPEPIMPMVDHLFKVGTTLLLVYAFIVKIPSWVIIRQVFFFVNLSFLMLFTAIVWLYWLQYLDVAPLEKARFSYFWGDIVYEVWVIALLCCGILFIWRARLAAKGYFVVACMVLLGREMFHIGNILVSYNRIWWCRAGELVMLLLYSGIMMIALQRYIALEVIILSGRSSGADSEAHGR